MMAHKEKMKYVTIQVRGFGAPSEPDGFIRWLEKKIDEQPVPRSEISISLDSDMEYDNCYAYIDLSYSRPETVGERDARIASEQRDEAWQRRQYETLKAKFGE